MELWIRSQNKEKLVKVNELSLYDSNILKNDFVLNDKPDYSNISIIANDNYNLGTYKSKERALEVLDEIATTIKNKYIVKPNTILKPDDIAKEHKRLNYLYSGEFIMENPPYEIVPINSNIIYYEMPEEWLDG